MSPEWLTSFCPPFHPNNSSLVNWFPAAGDKNRSSTTELDPFYSVAGGKGVEPLFTESESVVLPLNDPPVSYACAAPVLQRRRSSNGWGTRIRTSVARSRILRPTTRRSPNFLHARVQSSRLETRNSVSSYHERAS
jgi:hypothetical protein